jgi:hypothetical protein
MFWHLSRFIMTNSISLLAVISLWKGILFDQRQRPQLKLKTLANIKLSVTQPLAVGSVYLFNVVIDLQNQDYYGTLLIELRLMTNDCAN